MPAEPGRPAGADPRLTVVVITRNRRPELDRTLTRLAALPERPPVIVVDKGSEDDTWWEAGALARCADAVDRHPEVAGVMARIVAQPAGTDDPIVPELERSPVAGHPRLPGPVLMSFMAGASMLRCAAFRAVGGFSPRLFPGGGEELLAADLVARGHLLCYLPAAVLHHEASTVRDPARRRWLGIRNTLWFTCLRRPPPAALRRTAELGRCGAPGSGVGPRVRRGPGRVALGAARAAAAPAAGGGMAAAAGGAAAELVGPSLCGVTTMRGQRPTVGGGR